MNLKQLVPCFAAVGLLALSAIVSQSRAQTVKTDKTPIRPAIPVANRDDQSRVFLEHAETLRTTSDVDYQILVGDVQFRRGGMLMFCDSAHFYDVTGSFDAFGNVHMEQGDTLFVYADELSYNDSTQLAVLYADFGKKVRLINRDVTLSTDVFNYDLNLDLGYYEVGGVLTDKQNKLSSAEGEYNPTTKEAVFRQNVHLESLSDKDTLNIYTDYLYYNTDTHVAVLNDYSHIVSTDGEIFTTNGVYNTETSFSELYDRSLVVANNGNTLTGDTLFYNRNIGYGEAFGNIEICDTANKMLLRGMYGFYNELTDSAFVTGRAIAIEYSQGDSLFLHGDTIRAFRVITLPETASAPEVPVNPEAQANPITPANSIAPILPSELDSIAPSDTLNIQVVDAIVEPRDSIEKLLACEVAKPDTTRYIVAAPRVKFYRKDMQGLCDSMTFVSADTMIFMNYKPIVWSDNRQITGDLIQIHLNDSTVDWAKVPSSAFMAELIEDDFYNQLSGKEMVAKFLDGKLRHLDVNGNVLAITFPEEEDSTINKVANIESSFLAADFKDNTIEKMKLWSETNATVTPLYLAKKSLFFLQNFTWWGEHRPESPDDIFIFSNELIDLFNTARRSVDGIYRPQANVPVVNTIAVPDEASPEIPPEIVPEDEEVSPTPKD